MKKKIEVGILGATGTVGQKFAELLSDHPWFEVTALAASARSKGKCYREAMKGACSFADRYGAMRIAECVPDLPCKIVFSALKSPHARAIEESFALAGYWVISNASDHRMHPQVPLLIPEVNASHLDLIDEQPFGQGKIVTNPNCTVCAIALALKPLIDAFGVEKVHATSLQAVSGAGYPGVASLDILDNVIPFIAGEEEKIESEPLKIFGSFEKGVIKPYPMAISAQCNRVAVTDGHTVCLSIKLRKPAKSEQLISAWNAFQGIPQQLRLPTAPKQPIVYLEDERAPQPKVHRLLGGGMAVSVGRLRPCSILDWKFVLLSHNTIRGAAGCAILNAELLLNRFCSDRF